MLLQTKKTQIHPLDLDIDRAQATFTVWLNAFLSLLRTNINRFIINNDAVRSRPQRYLHPRWYLSHRGPLSSPYPTHKASTAGKEPHFRWAAHKLPTLLLHPSPHIRLRLLLPLGSFKERIKTIPSCHHHQHCLPLPPRYRLPIFNAASRRVYQSCLLLHLPMAHRRKEAHGVPRRHLRVDAASWTNFNSRLPSRHRHYRWRRLSHHPRHRRGLLFHRPFPAGYDHHTGSEGYALLGFLCYYQGQLPE